MTSEVLHKWLFREVTDLSKKYDRLEELIEKIAEKKN